MPDLTPALLDEYEEIVDAATPGPWTMQVHHSGTINVIYRTGDRWNKYGPGMLYSTVTLYNQGAYSDGITDDGVQLERHRTAKHVSTFDPVLCKALIAALREAWGRQESAQKLYDRLRAFVEAQDRGRDELSEAKRELQRARRVVEAADAYRAIELSAELRDEAGEGSGISVETFEAARRSLDDALDALCAYEKGSE